jgi:TPP-dependent trihydroxycyclohexane-1,2-dione (THcHDO) dehydratase
VAALGVVEAVKLAVGAIKDVLNAEWNIPLLSPLHAEIAGGASLRLPSALGIKRAAPAHTVIAILGDGSHLFNEPASCHSLHVHDRARPSLYCPPGLCPRSVAPVHRLC